MATGLMSLCMAGTASSAITVVLDPGTTKTTTALTGFATTGAMMDGMGVTAYFQGGGSQTAIWSATNSTDGGATGTGWSLTESGDTFSGPWTLTASALISKITIDAGLGNTVFDTTFGGVEGTPGSALGKSFTSTTSMDIIATYMDEVALTGFPPVGDLFRNLTIDFGNVPFGGALTNAQQLVFNADTDNIEFSGDIQSTPEPTTMILFGVGIAGLSGMRLRRKKA